MKYRELLNNITEVAKKHPNINSTFIGDVYELNHRNDVDYCAFVITQGTHRVNSDEDYIDYTLNLFYVDRLTADESNRTQIHSSGIDFMNSLLRAVEKLGVVVVEHTENVFNERFNDVCAGVYATVVLRVDIDECGQTIEIITPDELKVLKVTENGIYNGLFKQVDVNVQGGGKEPVLKSLSVTDNGTYTPERGVDGYNSVSVNVPKERHNVTSKSITANGKYNSEGDEVWNSVEVNVPENTFNTKSITKTYTANGQYSIATPDGYDGISDVNLTVNVPEKTTFNFNQLDNVTFHTDGATLDLTGLDTSTFTSMRNMFYYCEKITTLDVSHFDTSNVTDMSGMFHVCDMLTALDVSNFNTAKVTDMSNMFANTGLKALDLTTFDTSNVNNMERMLYNSNRLESLNVSNFNTSKVTDMSGMFHGIKPTELDLSSFDTSKVTDMSEMFGWCTNIVSLDLSHFNTSQVTDMSGMFGWCLNLKSLNISNWNMSKVTNVYQMFDTSSLIETIVCDGLQLPDIDLSYIALNSCQKLTVDSIVGLLNALPQSTHNYSFQIGQTNIDKLSEEQKAIATNKNWRLI